MSDSRQEELPVTPELIHAYFDGELEPTVRTRVEEAVKRHPALREELDTVRLLREAVGAGLDAAAAAVPEARFEQVWENIDRALDREARLRAAADREASVWSRLGHWARQLRWPTVAAAAAAVVTLVLVRSGTQENGTNTTDPVASVTPEVEAPPQTEPLNPSTENAPKVARAASEEPAPRSTVLPDPERNDAELEVIEFGGKTGRISRIEGQRGTTTVIWVTEEEPIDSERSL